MSQTTDMSLAGVAATSNCLLNNHSQDILKKFQWAIKKVSDQNRTENNDIQLTQDELIQLIQSWEPQRDIICLYVRWARQLRRNFNLDSLATLLCLSRQCNYTPIDFLRKVKTLSILRDRKAIYGVSFVFDIPNRKDIKNRDRLSKEFQGLSVTLALLQEQVTESPSILGKTKMRQSGPREVYRMNIPVNGNSDQPASMMAHPTIEFHTQSSLLSRIWKSINHRWLALYVTEHLFREADVPWSYDDALIYTFQMMAPCGPGRYEFLSPLVGYCLQFQTEESIASKRTRLRQIWNDPPSFLSYGNTFTTQFTTEAKARVITTCFQELNAEIHPNFKQISYHRDCSWLRRWTMVRAYVFHFWLESVSNSTLKATIASQLSSNVSRKKRKVVESTSTTPQGVYHNPLFASLTRTKVQRSMLKPPPTPRCNGLQSIVASRRSCENNPILTTPRTDRPTADMVGDKPVLGTTTGHSPMKDTDWTSLRHATFEEMSKFVQSYLIIHRLDGVDVLAELSPLEVYSANHLHDLIHFRLSGKSPFFPRDKTGPGTLHLQKEADYFIDHSAKSFHVAREQSEYFKEQAHELPSMPDYQLLCQTIVSHGSIDSKRAVGQYRLNIGNGGQNWVNGAPCKLHGLQWLNDLEEKDENIDADQVRHTIGRITEFTWRVACALQVDANDHPIAPDQCRRKLYAEHLNEFLNMDKDICFEDITLVVSSLHPVIHQVLPHKDTMNDTVAGYTRTAAFNMVLIDGNDDHPTIIHFQVICNFRKVIRNHLLPFHKYLEPVAKHCRHYLAKWDHSIRSVYAGKAVHIPSAHNRLPFFLDDSLEYTVVSISEKGKHKESISSEYLLTEVNVSRTLSLSMFIDPIVKLQNQLKFDQTIELAFACSFLSNPFWFDWCMSTLIRRLDDPNDPYKLDIHPFYDWAHNTISTFGCWQGGPYNRWSPCGGKEAIIDTFGATPDATREDRECGERKLSQVIAILYEHIAWINSLSSCGNMPVMDMPLSSMKAACNKTINAIAKVASCQFSHFRLGIFTTIMSGCGLLKQGKHLRNLMYPMKGSASFKHLGCPVADVMSPERARALSDNKTNESISNDGNGFIAEEQHDLFMQYLSAELGFKVYVRDEMECILCESHPMRSLNCRDWFRKGMSLYDCDYNGRFFCREYGRNTTWVELHPPERYDFSYLGKPSIVYIPLDAMLSYLAADFGNELRSDGSKKKVKFKGRNSRTSSHQRVYSNNDQTTGAYCHPSMQIADFYNGSHIKRKPLKSMFVLGDAEHAVPITDCNNLDNFLFGKRLQKYLQSLSISENMHLSTIAAGCYHMDSELSNQEVSFFPGHLDKPFVHTACFVSLGPTAFFTVLSVPGLWNLSQEAESESQFSQWKSGLSFSESKRVDDFLRDFDAQAQKHNRLDSSVRLIFVNKLGSLLSFPASICYHATITPKKPKGYPRDLFVFHPLDGLS